MEDSLDIGAEDGPDVEEEVEGPGSEAETDAAAEITSETA